MRKYKDKISIGKQKRGFCAILCLAALLSGHAQALNARYLEYIERFRDIALEHQRDYGVPAAITLAQGLLESNAGQSYLARRGNNHFGIKCHSWKGPVVEYDDTLQHNCYRNYGSPEDSFLDHAKFLKGRRYSALYDLDVSDYRGWAEGLRACGYAEDPAYPQKLTALIEQYELHRLTPAAPGSGETEAPGRAAARVGDAFGRLRDPDNRAGDPSGSQNPRPRPSVTRSRAGAAAGNASADND